MEMRTKTKEVIAGALVAVLIALAVAGVFRTLSKEEQRQWLEYR